MNMNSSQIMMAVFLCFCKEKFSVKYILNCI